MKRQCPEPCKLADTCKGPVLGYGDHKRASVVFIGEAPGEEEDRTGRPFVGKAGKERDRYLKQIGLTPENCYTTNLVKCRPPNNRDPDEEEKLACSRWLYEELSQIRSDAIIAPLGRHAAAFFIPDFDMELHHGIPQEWGLANTVVPIYHPAAGIHQTRFMSRIEADFQALADTLRGVIKPSDWEDDIPWAYSVLMPWDGLDIPKGTVIGIDTEDNRESIQISPFPRVSFYMRGAYAPRLRDMMEGDDYLWVFHNAQHDLPRVLKMVGCIPKRWTCTMLMANLLGRYSRALKVLAYRLCGMKMRTYDQVVSPYQAQKSLEYLEAIAAVNWPDPKEKKYISPKGEEKWKKPQPIQKKAQTALRDYKSRQVDLWKRWHNIPAEERLWPEKAFGPMPEATLADVPLDEAVAYACADPDATLRIYPILADEITELDLWDALERDQRACLMVIGMENHGMVLDVEAMSKLQDKYTREMETQARLISSYSDVPINPGSHPQIRDLLYKKLNLKAGKKSKKTGLLSTSDEALEMLKDKHPVVEAVLDYRKLGVLKSNFVEGSLENASRNDGIAKPELSMIAVETGRLACYRPNFLAFPVEERNEHGKELRDCFKAREGCVFLAGDYSQIELRVMAHEALEPTMMKAFIDGNDIHQATASSVFRVPMDTVTSAQRYEIKAVNFGIPYGISPDGLHEMLKTRGYTRQQCVELIAMWFQRFERVRNYLDQAKAEARRYGYVRDFLGRIRLIPEIKSALPQVRSAGERYAGNTKIQSGAASIVKEAMGQLNGVFTSFDFHPAGGPILQIHDEIIVEVPKTAVDWVAPMMRWTLENAIKISVPLKVDMKIGERWGSMEKMTW